MAERRQKTKGPSPRPPYQVFVSHVTADKWIARVICEKIEAIPGAATFRDDRDIAGGDHIPDVIQDQLERSNEMLLLLTAVAHTRQWVIMEVGLARAFRKRIVPICYNATVEHIPTIAMNRAFQLNDFDSYLDDLRSRVEDRK
jgi:TIR domain